MPHAVIAALFLLLSSQLSADSFKTKIHSVSEGEETLVKFTNGRVGYLPSHTKSLKLNSFRNQLAKVELDSESRIVSLGLSEIKGLKRLSSVTDAPLLKQTIFPERDDVVTLFERLNKTYKQDSECYNRAHIWAYEEYTKKKIVLNKVFVFFSDEYIRKHNFKWWFHVAPYALYRRDGALYAGVLDQMFSKEPQPIKKWTDTWIESKEACKVINQYSEYSSNTFPNECYLMKVDMFFWQPRDLENLEKGAEKKTSFLKEDLKYAYSEAFGLEDQQIAEILK